MLTYLVCVVILAVFLINFEYVDLLQWFVGVL